MFYHAFSYIHSYLHNLVFFVDVRHCFGLQETQAASTDAIPNLTWRQSILLSENHQVLVETDHTYHNVLSFDTADDRQHKSGWMSADHNTACFVLPLR